jgi:hypothetical protein
MLDDDFGLISTGAPTAKLQVEGEGQTWYRSHGERM